MQKVRQFLLSAWHYRYLILGGILLALAFIITMSSVAGIVSDAVECPREVVYGEDLGYRAKAVFQGVRYEYRRANSGEWSEEFPRSVGNFVVRAVSKGAGKTGEEHPFTVVPREIDVTVAKEWRYGDEPTLVGDVVYGDVLACSEYIYHYGDETTILPRSDHITVRNAEGEGVSQCYRIMSHESEVTVLPRPLSVTVESASKVYDGTPLVSEAYAFEGDLAFGDELRLDFPVSQTDAGSAENVPKVGVFSAAGRDMTRFYEIGLNTGTLTVTPRPLSVTLPDLRKIYDGEPLRLEPTEYGPEALGGLAAGQTAIVESVNDLLHAGSAPISGQVYVLDGDLHDVTANYTVSFEGGTFTVLPRPIVIRTRSEEWVYDGKPHTCPYYDLVPEQEVMSAAAGMALAKGDVLVFASDPPSVRDVGTAENLLGFAVLREETSEPVTEDYDITVEAGTLKVTPRPVTVASEGGSVVYDGADHACTDPSRMTVKEGFFVEGHTLVFLPDAELRGVTDGSRTNRFTLSVKDEEGNDCTQNYDITYEYGLLEIVPRTVHIITGSQEHWYDGQEHRCYSFEYAEDSPYKLVEGHFGRGEDPTPIREGGRVENHFAKFVIEDGDGNDVSGNYRVIEVAFGTVCVRYRVGVLLFSVSKVYDGTPLSYESDDWTYDAENNLGGLTLDLALRGSLTEVGSLPMSELEELPHTAQRNGRAVESEFYRVFFEGETLTVLPRKIEVTSMSVSRKYDGLPLTNGGWWISFGTLAAGQNAEVEVSGLLDHIGTAENTIVSCRIFDRLGQEVTENYEIVFRHGTLELFA